MVAVGKLARYVGGLMLAALPGSCFGQIHLPGLTIPDPRQPNRPIWSGNRPVDRGRPDPDRVCPQVIGWVQTLSNEYPGVDMAHTASGKLQQMAIPLFSDDAFQKQFGTSYAKMSDVDRRQFFTTHIIPCRTSRQYAQQTIVLEAFGSAFLGRSGIDVLSPAQLLPALVRLDSARNTLKQDEQQLQSGAASAAVYDSASVLGANRKDELSRVWPSEKAQFQAAVTQAITRSASVAMQAHTQQLLGAPASVETLQQLHNAPRTYAALLQTLPSDQRDAFQAQLLQRRQEILRQLLPPQQLKAAGFPATRQGLDEGAEWFGSYRAVFLDPPVLPEAESLAKNYMVQREAVLAKLVPQFRRTVATADDAEAVASMFDDVFRLAEDRQTDLYRQLKEDRAARAELLTKRANLKHRTEEAKAEQEAIRHGDLISSSLKTENLQNATIFRAIFAGDFAHAGVQRASVTFVDMFGGYLARFGQACSANLPPDKVEMSVKECARSQHLVNGYGLQVSPDTCIEWGRRPIGVYADPRAFAAKVSLEDAAQANGMRDLIGALASSDATSGVLGKAGGMVSAGVSIGQDLPKLISENGCSSKALARLQENLTRFASSEEPVRLSSYVPDAGRITKAGELDVRALADDLIRANAAGWLMNRYTGLDGASTDGSPDELGRTRRVHATYEQKGVLSRGAVDIAFVDGVPSCLYFSDDPGNCKAPSPSVIQRYEDGAYRRKSNQ